MRHQPLLLSPVCIVSGYRKYLRLPCPTYRCSPGLSYSLTDRHPGDYTAILDISYDDNVHEGTYTGQRDRRFAIPLPHFVPHPAMIVFDYMKWL